VAPSISSTTKWSGGNGGFLEVSRFESCPDYKFLTHFYMEKTLLIMVVMLISLQSCNKKNVIIETKSESSTIIDSSLIDIPVSDDEARDYLNDTIR
jgi:hypothetical protein